MDPLYLLGIGALLMLLFGFRRQREMARKLARRIPGKTALPQALHVAIMATQLYELALVVKHASLVTISAALLLLAIVVASKSGTEDYATDFHRGPKPR